MAVEFDAPLPLVEDADTGHRFELAPENWTGG